MSIRVTQFIKQHCLLLLYLMLGSWTSVWSTLECKSVLLEWRVLRLRLACFWSSRSLRGFTGRSAFSGARLGSPLSAFSLPCDRRDFLTQNMLTVLETKGRRYLMLTLVDPEYISIRSPVASITPEISIALVLLALQGVIPKKTYAYLHVQKCGICQQIRF